MRTNEKKTDNYMLYGAYHWYWYGNRVAYTQHVNFLKRWIEEKNVIDIGAGDGLITAQLGVRGIDKSRYAVDLAELKGVKVDLGDATKLPYKNGEFEAALISDTLEYIKNTSRALLEARRVIKKCLYISIPIALRYVESEPEYFWTPEKLIAMVEKRGFKLVNGPRIRIDRLRVYFKFEKVPLKRKRKDELRSSKKRS